MKINFKYLYLILLPLYFIYFSQLLNPYLFALGLIWIFYSFLITSNSIKFSAFGKSFLLELTKKRKEKIFYYLLLITFLLTYFVLFPGKTTLILAQTETTTTTIPECPSDTVCVPVEICQYEGLVCYKGCGTAKCCCGEVTTTTTTTQPTTTTTIPSNTGCQNDNQCPSNYVCNNGICEAKTIKLVYNTTTKLENV
jgi:hypothetical protein